MGTTCLQHSDPCSNSNHKSLNFSRLKCNKNLLPTLPGFKWSSALALLLFLLFHQIKIKYLWKSVIAQSGSLYLAKSHYSNPKRRAISSTLNSFLCQLNKPFELKEGKYPEIVSFEMTVLG